VCPGEVQFLIWSKKIIDITMLAALYEKYKNNIFYDLYIKLIFIGVQYSHHIVESSNIP